ncbi:HpcH/HpaI aldolase/citrate lyase family protein [Amycolatopsis panacis]|uniref:CoA ester lyase n=1 Tax=Amycolatopsis panacis TaxID=2340917 RepID=A0A419I2B0_9PSEU|nr:CoA ester lyase [Amycolatopsis panacis]RJQ83990.1 CoA ester lyase [Amycolatopsis panacis]
MNLGRTLLFSPGDHSRRVERVLASSAATVVLDLEDGVADGEAKARGRATIAHALSTTDRAKVFVRVNATGTADHAADLDALGPVLGRTTGIILPKVESREEITVLAARLGEFERVAGSAPGSLKVVPVIETCAGLLVAPEIAASVRVAGLIFGALDLAAELAVSPISGLDHTRAQVAVAARAAGLRGPIDGPHPDLDDDDGLAETSLASRALGFSGRVVLHPRQIDIVERAYTPTTDEILRARQIVQASESNAGSLRLPDGTFVDRPVVARAQALLAEVGE